MPNIINAQNIKLSKKEKTWLEQNKDSIVFSLEYNYAPFIFEDEKGNAQGLSIDIIKEIENILNIKFRYKKFHDLSEILEAIKNNNTDIVSSIKNTAERKDHIAFSEAYIEVPGVIVSSTHLHKTLSLTDLHEYKIAIAEETSLFYRIKKSYPEYKVYTYKTEFDCLNGLINGEVDITLTDAASFSNYQTISFNKDIKVSNIIPFSYNLSFGVPLNKKICNYSGLNL